MELCLQLFRVYFSEILSKFYFFFWLKFWLIRFANQFNFLRFGCVELNENHPLSKWGFKTTFHDKNDFFTAFYKFDRCECSISLSPPPLLYLSLSYTHTHTFKVGVAMADQRQKGVKFDSRPIWQVILFNLVLTLEFCEQKKNSRI